MKAMTGIYRDGYCNTGHNDLGIYTVCSKVTDVFFKIFLEGMEMAL